jgi:hypothetical protein
MKVLVLYMFLCIGFCFGQFFEQKHENVVFFEQISPPNEIEFFQESYLAYAEPEYEIDDWGQPGDPVSINNSLIVLLIFAFGIVLFFKQV